MFVAPMRIYRKYHVSMYSLRKIFFHFLSKEKISYFREKIPSFQIIQERSYSSAIFEKTIISEHLKKISSHFHVFFWERSSFIFRSGSKIIFSGKRNIIFPDNTRKIIFHPDFFRETIFSGRLAKENFCFINNNFSSTINFLCWSVNVWCPHWSCTYLSKHWDASYKFPWTCIAFLLTAGVTGLIYSFYQFCSLWVLLLRWPN